MGNLVKVSWREDVTMECSIRAKVPDEYLESLKNSEGKDKTQVIQAYARKNPKKCDKHRDQIGGWPIEDRTVRFEVIEDNSD
ncbi:MAG: hypothetical protein ABEJ72_03440 [Candidatus Aenigmatarchaeota archaeon]